MVNKQKTAVYPGTFDPITNGHLDIIKRAGKIFDKVIVSIGINRGKTPLFSVDERKSMIEEATKTFDNVEVDVFQGLMVNYCKDKGASTIIRGLRAVSDFENEMQMALMNKKIGNDIETIFLMPNEKNTYLSSSIVREIARYGGEISLFVPECVKNEFEKKDKL